MIAVLFGLLAFNPQFTLNDANSIHRYEYHLVASGCGSRGGPGWREIKTGKCVSKKTFAKLCGRPPSTKRCRKES